MNVADPCAPASGDTGTPETGRRRAPMPREQIVAALFDLFREAGFDGVSISDVSRATGLGKSSLYHHFPGGKEDMAAAVMAVVEAWLAERIEGPLAAGDRTQRIDAMLAAVEALFDGGTRPCIMASLLVGHPTGGLVKRLGSVLGRWIGALAGALEATGDAPEAARRKATAALVRIEGALIVARALGSEQPFREALSEVRADLHEPTPPAAA